MRLRALTSTFPNQAPRFLGAFLCAAALAFLPACKKASSPDWKAPEATATTTPEVPKQVQPKTPVRATSSPEGFRFITYNVENWLTMERYVDGKIQRGKPKPESEKQAVVDILTRHSPDIIGLCEVGKATDLAEIQERLKAAGLDLPHSHYTGGSDPTRHLALLSRFPIVSTAKPAETEYRLGGQTFALNRGILDASITARGKSYRFLGVHLKSKRDSEQGDQEAIRLHEARLVRRHVDSILRSDATARLVVYGDFNDTRSTPVIKTITGKYSDSASLTAIPAKDSHQTAWTHYWALHDIYSRLDFVMVTRSLRKEVDFPAARIIDDEGWDKASDHRPVLAVFK